MTFRFFMEPGCAIAETAWMAYFEYIPWSQMVIEISTFLDLDYKIQTL